MTSLVVLVRKDADEVEKTDHVYTLLLRTTQGSWIYASCPRDMTEWYVPGKNGWTGVATGRIDVPEFEKELHRA